MLADLTSTWSKHRLAGVGFTLLFGVLLATGIASRTGAAQSPELCFNTETGLNVPCPRRMTQAELDATLAAERRFQQGVDDYIRQHGPHRRAEAERFVRMQQAAELARGNRPTTQNSPAQCAARMIPDGFQSPWSPNPAAARAQADEWAGRMCNQNGRTCTGVTCRTENFGTARSPDIVTSCSAGALRSYQPPCGSSAVSRE